MRRVAEFAASLGNVERVDVLPFHKLGAFKWKELGLRDPLEKTAEPPPESVVRARAAFVAAGFSPSAVK